MPPRETKVCVFLVRPTADDLHDTDVSVMQVRAWCAPNARLPSMHQSHHFQGRQLAV